MLFQLIFFFFLKFKRSVIPCTQQEQINTVEPTIRVRWCSLESEPESGSPPRAIIDEDSADSSPCSISGYVKSNLSQKLSVPEVLSLCLSSEEYYIQLVEAKKTEKNEKIPPEWENQRDIIILNCDPKLEAANSRRSIKKYFKEKFKEYPFVQIEEIQMVYFEGCVAYILTVNDERSTKFLHFNLVDGIKRHKRFLGENIQIGLLRKKNNQNIPKVVVRFLPLDYGKDKLQILLNESKNIKIEEPFEFQGSNYTIIYGNTLEECEKIQQKLLKYFNSKQISQVNAQVIKESNYVISDTKKKSFENFVINDEDNQQAFFEQLEKYLESIKPKQIIPSNLGDMKEIDVSRRKRNHRRSNSSSSVSSSSYRRTEIRKAYHNEGEFKRKDNHYIMRKFHKQQSKSRSRSRGKQRGYDDNYRFKKYQRMDKDRNERRFDRNEKKHYKH